jgi:predicted negative regulator of RcsB-dependent stress response
MAAPSHRKLSRKELRQPDEFVTALEWASEFAADNLTRIIAGLVALVAAIAIGFGYSFYQQHQRLLASDQFYRGINALSDKKYASAVQNLGTLAANRPGGKLGHLAQLYLATTYLTQNQPAKARDELNAFLAHGGDDQFRQLAFVQLGVSQETLGDYRDAHSAYAEAARLPGPEKTNAQINAARTLTLMGDRKAAIEAYQRFLQENPYAQQSPIVVEALAQMGVPANLPQPAAMPAEIYRNPPAKGPASRLVK